MFAEFHRRAFALRHYIRFERAHLRIVRGEPFTARRLFDAPVDHVAQRRHETQLYLKLLISFRLSVGRVRAPHRAGAPVRTADQLVVVEDFIRGVVTGAAVKQTQAKIKTNFTANRLYRPPESSSPRSDMCFITFLS